MQQSVEDSWAQINWGFWIFNWSGPNYGHQTVLLNTLTALSPYCSFPKPLRFGCGRDLSPGVFFQAINIWWKWARLHQLLIATKNTASITSPALPLGACTLARWQSARTDGRCKSTRARPLKASDGRAYERRLVSHPCRLMLLDLEKQLGVNYNWADTNNESRYCLEALGNMLKILMPLIIQGLDRVEEKSFFPFLFLLDLAREAGK